jgi:hypothetical protein
LIKNNFDQPFPQSYGGKFRRKENFREKKFREFSRTFALFRLLFACCENEKSVIVETLTKDENCNAKDKDEATRKPFTRNLRAYAL